MILQLLLLLSWDNVQFICFISIYSLNFCAALQGLAAWVVTLLNFTLCDLGVICKRYHNLMISELEPWKLRRIEGWSQHTSDQTPLGLPFGVSLTERQHEGCSLNLSVNWDLNDWGGRWGLQEKHRNLLDGAGWGGKTISVWPMSALPMTLVWRVQEPSLGSCWTCPCTCLALLWLSSLLSQPGKAPQPNLSHMPWDGGEVPCSERNSPPHTRGGLASLVWTKSRKTFLRAFPENHSSSKAVDWGVSSCLSLVPVTSEGKPAQTKFGFTVSSSLLLPIPGFD